MAIVGKSSEYSLTSVEGENFLVLGQEKPADIDSTTGTLTGPQSVQSEFGSHQVTLSENLQPERSPSKY